MNILKKHAGNLVSWSSFCINVLILLLLLNDKVQINFMVVGVFIAAFLDMFDGKLARLFITKKEDFIFGELTDSLCDTINFGIVPMFIFIYFFSSHIFISFIVVSFYLWAIVYRLARFSKTKNETLVSHYIGIPVTVIGPISSFFTVTFSSSLILVVIIQLFLSYLMVSNLKVKKLIF